MEYWSRRNFLKLMGITTLHSTTGCLSKKPKSTQRPGISASTKDDVVLIEGLSYQTLIAWGDPINEKESFGFNNDFIALHSLNENEGLMWINHEYVNPKFLKTTLRTKENIEKEQKQVGGSIIKIRKDPSGNWFPVINDPLNRRVDGTTPIPFAKDVEVLGSKQAIGTLANCAGGYTPWGTFLTCEENYDGFYGERYNGEVQGRGLKWNDFFDYPPEHYGWVVEIEPKTGKARKHTTLGRFAHESATVIPLHDGRVVVYSGDDKGFEHIYKFVSSKPNSLEEGTLFVANIEKGRWLPLDLEMAPQLQPHFKTQLDVLINARKAAKILGATPLDRPEDIEINPLNSDVIVALTLNHSNNNFHGSLLRIRPHKGQHDSDRFKAETMLMGGPETGVSAPDNLAFDKYNNLWITTDRPQKSLNKKPYKNFGNNALFVIPAKGKWAGLPIQIASAPIEAEFTGPCFSPDGKTLFLSVQHPGEGTVDIENPTSTWPTGKLPKPAVIGITGPLLDKIHLLS